MAITLYLCASVLRAPERPPEVNTAPAPLVADSAAQTIAAWVGPGEVRMNVRVLGLMIRDGRAVALLKVNDGPPRVVMSGETVVGGATVQRIDPDAVTIATPQGATRIPAPRPPKDGPGLTVRSR